MRSILCAAMLALATTTAGAEEFDYSANNMLPYCKAFANEGMHTTTMTNAVGASYCNGMISMLVYLTPSLEVWPEECMQSPKGATTPQIARVIVRSDLRISSPGDL